MWWRSIALKAFYDQSRATLGLALFMAAYAGLIMGIYPSISGIIEIGPLFERLPEAFRVMFAPGGLDITTPEGFVAAEFFSIIGPLLFFAYTIGIGGSATAGEEERGTIDLLMSLPIPRWRVVLEKYVTVVVGTVVLGAALVMGMAAGAFAGGIDLRYDGIGAIVASAILLGLLFGALALFVGALTGRRTFSIGVAFALAVASYLVYSLSALVDLIKPLRPFSPFTYYVGGNPLSNGLNAVDAGILAGATIVLVVLAVVAFRRRDLRV